MLRFNQSKMKGTGGGAEQERKIAPGTEQQKKRKKKKVKRLTRLRSSLGSQILLAIIR